MDEFSQSRYRLESRYHHVLVDEFQDTSRLPVAARRAARPVVGRGLRSGARRAAPAVALHRRRSQAVDLPLPRRRRHAARRGGGDDRAALRPPAAAAARSRAASARGRRCSLSSTTCARVRRRRGAVAARRLPLRRAGSLPDRGRPPRPADREPALGLVVGEDGEPTAALVAAEIARLLATATVRDRESGLPRRVAARRHRDPVPVARRAPRVRARARSARASRPTSTRGSASSMPTRSRTWSRSSACWLRRPRTCAPRRSCDRAWSRLSDHALARLAPRSRRRAHGGGAAGGGGHARSRRRGAARAGAGLARGVAPARRSRPARRRPRPRARRLGLRRRAHGPRGWSRPARTSRSSGAGAPRRQPRLRDDGPPRQPHRSAGDRRRSATPCSKPCTRST